MKIPLALSLLTLLLAVVPTGANDSYFAGVAGVAGVAGAPTPVQSQTEHLAIRMESEKVVLTLRPNDLFDTDANFVFVNDSGKSVAVQMGFPEQNIGVGDDDEFGGADFGFNRFATSVNGRRIAAKRTKVRNAHFNSWWLKTVSFAPHETKRIRVMATSRLGGDTSSASGILSYNFTGGNWKGLVSKSELEVRVPLRGMWQASSFIYADAPKYERKSPQFSRRNGVGVLRYEWTNWQAEGRARVGLMRLMPHNLSYAHASPAETAKYYGERTYFQIGKAVDRADNFRDTTGFVRDGVGMIAFSYLSEVGPRYAIYSTYDAKTGRATLHRGDIEVSFVAGNKMMRAVKNGVTREVKLPLAPVLLKVGREGERLYVPLRAAAQALDLSVDVARHYVSVGLRK